ncbi:unnamed protein product [Discosporangium mesarthrocarpum]
MRESTVPVLSAKGEFHVMRRHWIDSSAIARRLEYISEDDGQVTGSGGGASESARRHTKQIAIFLFSLGGPDPFYVDERWQAVPVGDHTVLVVQSEPLWAPTQLTCGGLGLGTSPRNPLRPALAALGGLVGGLVPPQVGVDESRSGGGLRQDWTWAMSESPMSPFVHQARFSKLEKDIVCRTHVVHAVSASVLLSRAGASLLTEALQNEGSRDEGRSYATSHWPSSSLWSQASACSRALRYSVYHGENDEAST